MGKRQRRSGGGSGGAGSNHMNFMALVYVDSGQTAAVTLQSFLTGCEKSLSGLPWRLVWARAEASVLSVTGGPMQPALVQMRLNDAKQENVESIASIRWTVFQLPRVRTLRMPHPNLWKEDEERGQQLISFDNIPFGGSPTTRVLIFVTARIQFGALMFTPSKSLATTFSKPYPPEDDDQGGSFVAL